MTRLSAVLTVALAAGALAALPDAVTGCGAAPRRGESIDVADEAALVVWDEKARTEHFIRSAHFRSTGYDFGFLVPTPNPPSLEVAGDDLFRELVQITAPKVEYREVVREVERDFAPGCSRPGAANEQANGAEKLAAGAAPGGVEVLEQKRVGDYDATVLAFRKGDGDTAASGAAELARWLAKHGYESSPAIEKWLQKYVDDRWCITAFKIAAPEPKAGPNRPAPQTGPHDLRARPIRMSFKADRPFYPYREPETEQMKPPGESRLLRVFVAAPVRFSGKLGDGARPWPGRTVWAGAVDSGRWNGVYSRADLTGGADARRAPIDLTTDAHRYWLTEFEDRSSPRPGTDEVYFEPAADPSPVERPPTIINKTRIVMVTPWWHVAVMIGVPVALALGGLVMWRVLRRE